MMPRRLLALLLFAAFALTQATASPDGPVALKVEPAKTVGNYTFTLAHATFTFYSGRASRILYGDQVVGICFKGNGSMDLLSQLPVEYAALEYNLAHNGAPAALKGPDGLHTGTRFQQAIIWMGGREIQPFSGPDDTSLEGVLQAVRDQFQSTQVANGLSGVLARKANGGDLPYIQADMDGGTTPFIYEYDPTHLRFETLYLLSRENMDNPSLKGMYNPVTLSHQPIGWDLHQPVFGDYMLKSVDVDLTQTAPFQGLLKVKEIIQPTFAPLKVIRLNFQGTHWGYNGYSPIAHHATIAKVTDAQGQALTFIQDGNEVSVQLATAADPKTPVELNFQIEGDFLVPPTNGNYWQLGTTAWYPQPELNGQLHTWHAIVRVKKPYLAFSGGNTVRRWQENGYEAIETRSDTPIAFGVVLAGEYTVQRETRQNLTVEVATYGGNAQFTKGLMDIAFLSISYYENFLGPYPYKEFHILEKNEWGYGQAPATVMFITKEAFNQTLTQLNQAVAQGVRGRFVHEIAHQWWGTVVKMPNEDEQWLTESFAEICASLCLQDWPQHRADNDYAKLIATWKTEGAFAADKATIPTANYIYNPTDSYQNFRIRTGLIYNKGAWLLQCIRQEIGDQAFLTFLKSYQRNFRWRFGTTKDVVGLLNFITKKDWQPWFEQNYWGTGMPALKK
jgi:hypothetical protein